MEVSLSTDYCFEDAEFGEPLDLDHETRIKIFPKGDGVRVKLERLVKPIIVNRPGKSVDFSSGQGQTKADDS